MTGVQTCALPISTKTCLTYALCPPRDFSFSFMASVISVFKIIHSDRSCDNGYPAQRTKSLGISPTSGLKSKDCIFF